MKKHLQNLKAALTVKAVTTSVKNRCADKGTRQLVLQMAIMCSMAVASHHAMAGTGGNEFDTIWLTLTDWMQGTLGRVVSGAMVLVGIVGGIIRQSVMAFATGVGGGIGLYNTPKVIEAIMTATLPTI